MGRLLPRLFFLNQHIKERIKILFSFFFSPIFSTLLLLIIMVIILLLFVIYFFCFCPYIIILVTRWLST